MARRTQAEDGAQETDAEPSIGSRFVELTAGLVSSYVSRNQVPMAELPALIAAFHAALAGAAAAHEPEAERKPAVAIKKSVSDDYIICLEDGKRLTMLKRYLRSQFNMSPDEYRKKWDLPHDYPMVAPAYARMRSAFAKRSGLGRVSGAKGQRPKTAA